MLEADSTITFSIEMIYSKPPILTVFVLNAAISSNSPN